MLLTLYDQYGNVKTTLSPDDSSRQVKEIQGDNVLTLSFTLYEYVSVDVNDYVDFWGERYWAKEKYLPKEKSTVEWTYNLTLYGIESLLTRFLVLKTVDGDADAVFSMTDSPMEHVRLIVASINEGMGTTDWKVGTVTGTGNVTIDYVGKYCDEALKELAEAVGTEWWIEGNTVNLCRCEHGEEVTLGYGHGLVSLDRDMADNAKFYTRLFPIGSCRNIDSAHYGHSRLQLPNGAKYVDVNVEQYGIIHHYEQDAFVGIYPRRVGTVSSVRSEVVTGDDGKPFTIYYFKDNGLTFDPNDYEIGGLVKHVSFLEGSELAGLGTGDDHYFEVNFNSETREFEIITIWPYDDDTQLPGGRLVPRGPEGTYEGDPYILWNIRMPEEYYGMAEQEFKRAVDAYNAEHALDVSVYKAPTDHVWVEEQEESLPQGEALLYVGRRVRLESDDYFPATGYRSSRITRISCQVTLPSLMDLEISDALSTKVLERIDDAIGDVKAFTKAAVGALQVPDLIKSWEKTPATDTNVFSARRIVKQFLDKLTLTRQRVAGSVGFGGDVTVDDDFEVSGDTELNGNLQILGSHDALISGDTYANGNLQVGGDTTMDEDARIEGDLTFGAAPFGNLTTAQSRRTFEENVKGCKIYWNGSGWMVETDYLNVHKKMTAKTVEVDEVTHIGGEEILTEAACVADGVESYMGVNDDLHFYRVYFRKKDSQGRVTYNRWKVGDQAYCQMFNINAGESTNFSNRYYWRYVCGSSAHLSNYKGTEEIPTSSGANFPTSEFHFIDLHMHDQDNAGVMRTDSNTAANVPDVPQAEDRIIQLGYREQNGDDADFVKKRQGATLISGGGQFGRSIIMWEGIGADPSNYFHIPNARVLLSPNLVKLTVDELNIHVGGTDKSVEQYVQDETPKFEIFQTGTSAVPTTSNAPFTNWTNDEKVLYSTSPNNAVILNADGRTWKFVTSGNGYAFEEFTDPWLLAQHRKVEAILDDDVVSADEMPVLEEWMMKLEADKDYVDTVSQELKSSAEWIAWNDQLEPLLDWLEDVCSAEPPFAMKGYRGEEDLPIDTTYSRTELTEAKAEYEAAKDAFMRKYVDYQATKAANAAKTSAQDYVTSHINTIAGSTIDSHIKDLVDSSLGGTAAVDYNAAVAKLRNYYTQTGRSISENSSSIGTLQTNVGTLQTNLNNEIDNRQTAINNAVVGIRANAAQGVTLESLGADIQAKDGKLNAVVDWMGASVNGQNVVTPKATFGSSGLAVNLGNLFVGISSVTFSYYTIVNNKEYLLQKDGTGVYYIDDSNVRHYFSNSSQKTPSDYADTIRVDNINKSGLVTTTDFASVFAEAADPNTGDITRASFAAYIRNEADSAATNAVSHADISADQVFIQSGNQNMGDYFKLENGNVTMQNLFAHDITIEGIFTSMVKTIRSLSDMKEYFFDMEGCAPDEYSEIIYPSGTMSDDDKKDIHGRPYDALGVPYPFAEKDEEHFSHAFVYHSASESDSSNGWVLNGIGGRCFVADVFALPETIIIHDWLDLDRQYEAREEQGDSGAQTDYDGLKDCHIIFPWLIPISYTAPNDIPETEWSVVRTWTNRSANLPDGTIIGAHLISLDEMYMLVGKEFTILCGDGVNLNLVVPAVDFISTDYVNGYTIEQQTYGFSAEIQVAKEVDRHSWHTFYSIYGYKIRYELVAVRFVNREAHLQNGADAYRYFTGIMPVVVSVYENKVEGVHDSWNEPWLGKINDGYQEQESENEEL